MAAVDTILGTGSGSGSGATFNQERMGEAKATAEAAQAPRRVVDMLVGRWTRDVVKTHEIREENGKLYFVSSNPPSAAVELVRSSDGRWTLGEWVLREAYSTSQKLCWWRSGGRDGAADLREWTRR